MIEISDEKATKGKMNVCDIIQAQLVKRFEDAIESGEKFYWVKPWRGGAPYPCSFNNPKKPFSVINSFLLEPGEYLTFSKIKELHEINPDIKIKKGAKTVPVYQYFPIFRKDKNGEFVLNEEGEKCIQGFSFRYVREYAIWDVEGVKSHFMQEEYTHATTDDMKIADQIIERYCAGSGIEMQVKKGANQAYFSNEGIGTGRISLPDRTQFPSAFEYYSTVFHELAHSTLAETKRNEQKFSYAQEELVAEMAASIMCSYLHISDDKSEKNNIAYLKSWRDQLKKEKSKAIVIAANEANATCNCIFSYSPKLIQSVERDRQRETKTIRR